MIKENIKIGCINKDCPDYGVINKGNIRIRRVVGKNQIKMLRCLTCKKEFSERNGTPLFDLKLAPQKIEEVLKHLGEGCGIRATARLTGVHKDTVMSLSKKVGLHCKKVHDAYVKNVHVKETQLDEKWAFVGLKDKNNVNKIKKKAPSGTI